MKFFRPVTEPGRQDIPAVRHPIESRRLFGNLHRVHHRKQKDTSANPQMRHFGGKPGQCFMRLEHSHWVGDVVMRAPDRFEAAIGRDPGFFRHELHGGTQILVRVELRRYKQAELHFAYYVSECL